MAVLGRSVVFFSGQVSSALRYHVLFLLVILRKIHASSPHQSLLQVVSSFDICWVPDAKPCKMQSRHRCREEKGFEHAT